MGSGAVAQECDGEARLRAQLAEAWAEIKTLRRTVAHQARLLTALASETSPSAPSLNCVYWLWAQGRYHEKSWRHVWNRIKPLLDDIGTLLAPDLTPIVWERHRSVRRTEVNRFGGTPCEYTLDIELSRAKEMLDWAVTNQMISFNPLAAATYSNVKSERQTDLRRWDVDKLLVEAESLRDRRLDEADDDGRRAAQLQAFILVCFDSMLRFNEAQHLRRDLIEDNGDYRVPGAHAKGGKPRTVTLTPRTIEAIAKVPSHPSTNDVFVDPATGVVLGATTLRGWFRWACEVGNLDARAAPGERIVPHLLRHAGASEADRAGARATAIQDAMGHSSMRTTARYLHREKSESSQHVAQRMIAATATPRRPPVRRARRKRRPPQRAPDVGKEKVGQPKNHP